MVISLVDPLSCHKASFILTICFVYRIFSILNHGMNGVRQGKLTGQLSKCKLVAIVLLLNSL